MPAFDPGQLYRGLYELPCFQALEENSTSPAFAQHMSNCVQSNLKVMFARMEREGTSAKVIHAENIRLNVSVLSVLRSNRTCLYCIRREPEHVLQCGHTVCDICTRIFGSPDTTFDFQYTVGSCLACDSGSTTITLKPPTSGVRVLTVDGGGIRGVVPLEFLGIIQDLLGPGCAIQDMFDLAFGTSSGRL